MPESQFLGDDRVIQFHENQVWESPKGSLYRVESVISGGLATLRQGKEGTGRKVTRDWDAVPGWVIYQEAPPLTHKLVPRYSGNVSIGYDLSLIDAAGDTIGFATVSHTGRTACLGLNAPQLAIAEQQLPSRRPRKGRGWMDVLLVDTAQFLCQAHGVNLDNVDLREAKSFLATNFQ